MLSLVKGVSTYLDKLRIAYSKASLVTKILVVIVLVGLYVAGMVVTGAYKYISII
ncbi:hypothetical protein D3C81_11620 [compost metagenome]